MFCTFWYSERERRKWHLSFPRVALELWMIRPRCVCLWDSMVKSSEHLYLVIERSHIWFLVWALWILLLVVAMSAIGLLFLHSVCVCLCLCLCVFQKRVCLVSHVKLYCESPLQCTLIRFYTKCLLWPCRYTCDACLSVLYSVTKYVSVSVKTYNVYASILIGYTKL